MVSRVKSVFRELGAQVARVSVLDKSSQFNTSLYADVIRSGEAPPDHIRTPTEAAHVIFDVVQTRIEERLPRQVSDRTWCCRVLAAVITDAICYIKLDLDTEQAVRSLLRKIAPDLMSDGFDQASLDGLSALLGAGAMRDFIIEFLRHYTEFDLHDLVAEAGLELPLRAAHPTPHDIKLFHSSDRPIQYWVSDAQLGKTTFIVYYTAPCSYKVCLGCALPDLSATAVVSASKIIDQTDYVLRRALSPSEKSSTHTLVISNNGSVLDSPTFPVASLLHAMQVAIDQMKALKCISLETRAEFVTHEILEQLLKSIAQSERPDVRLEIALGVEVFDDGLRNKSMHKGLSRRKLIELCELLGSLNVGLRAYMMLKPVPGMSDEDAINDIAEALTFFENMAESVGLDCVMHVNPTYAAIGTELETALSEGQFSPPRLDKMVERLKALSPQHVELHFGLNDEGLAAPGGSFINEKNEGALDMLVGFNRIGLDAFREILV
ncbi:MAG: hypothetical protein ACRBEQ_07885 [Hyphomonas sp.]